MTLKRAQDEQLRYRHYDVTAERCTQFNSQMRTPSLLHREVSGALNPALAKGISQSSAEWSDDNFKYIVAL